MNDRQPAAPDPLLDRFWKLVRLTPQPMESIPMNRRTFLYLAAAASAGFALDPDLALWKPGRKTIFLPSSVRPATPTEIVPVDWSFRKGDVFTIAGRYAINPITRQATEHLQQFVVLSDVAPSDCHVPFAIKPSVISPPPGLNIGKRRARPLYTAPLASKDRAWSGRRA